MRSCHLLPLLLGSCVAGRHDGDESPAYGAEFGGSVPQSCYQLPHRQKLINQTYTLPDPFRFLDGRPVHDAADWHCRSAQLRELIMEYELGYKPPRPPVFSSTYSNSTLTVVAGLSETKTINFSVPITPPNVTTEDPSPAVLAFDAVSVPIPAQAATMVLDVDQIALQDSTASRGIGLFYELYGNGTHTAGALMAWAWAVSRIIDALEQHPEANVNLEKLAVTGCSRNGKRGTGSCRDMLVNRDHATQTAWEIVTENVWFAESFGFFGRDNYTVGLLPEDHHELACLVAPRGLYSTENVGFLWLGDWSNYECMKAANFIYEALDAKDHQGFSQDGPHEHCSFPADQQNEIAAFYDRFLFDQPASTEVFRTVGNWTFDPRWTPWAAQLPELA